MTRKFFALLLAAVLLMTSMPALADGGDSRLTSLTHNCPNTGKMLPETFNPDQLSYILTVADWVSRVTFTPTADGVIYVNGVQVPSGQKSQVIQMTDEPQQVTIQVVNGSTTTYTVYLQRRPSEKRTRVSAGFITGMILKNGVPQIEADLVTVNYQSNSYADGNRSTWYNDSSYLYKYPAAAHCLFYCEMEDGTVRAVDSNEFFTVYDPEDLFRIIYIEDEIVAVLPYSADY
ncbi:MAG: cadherin-like beta sandwich domain-containing protein [Clostridia bacterium]|nr:cadherin-like beta sandwich domain-containing protein [Clostridia bacterium]